MEDTPEDYFLLLPDGVFCDILLHVFLTQPHNLTFRLLTVSKLLQEKLNKAMQSANSLLLERGHHNWTDDRCLMSLARVCTGSYVLRELGITFCHKISSQGLQAFFKTSASLINLKVQIAWRPYHHHKSMGEIHVTEGIQNRVKGNLFELLWRHGQR